jgi:hypothetical protein
MVSAGPVVEGSDSVGSIIILQIKLKVGWLNLTVLICPLFDALRSIILAISNYIMTDRFKHIVRSYKNKMKL